MSAVNPSSTEMSIVYDLSKKTSKDVHDTIARHTNLVLDVVDEHVKNSAAIEIMLAAMVSPIAGLQLILGGIAGREVSTLETVLFVEWSQHNKGNVRVDELIHLLGMQAKRAMGGAP